MRLSQRKGYINSESYVAQYLALAFFTIGVCRTLGVDDLLAAFAAGLWHSIPCGLRNRVNFLGPSAQGPQ